VFNRSELLRNGSTWEIRKGLDWFEVSIQPAANQERVRSAVEELLASDTLARSEQLRSFLRYVCDRTLAGHGKEINEYSVAVEALGKPAGFSPGEDSSVRRNAYELRQKLQRYYETERPDAPIRVELPKGSYTPRFVEPETPPVDAPPPPARVNRILAVALAASVLVSIGLAVLRTSAPRVDAAVREAWAPLASSGAPVLISVGTSLHLIVRPYMTVVAEGLPKYPAPPELYPMFRQHRPLDDGVELSMHPVDNSVQMGHAEALAIASTTLSLLGIPYQTLPERSASPAALRGRSVILIGDPQNSNSVAQALRNMPLTLEFDAAAQDVVVRERAGSKLEWAGKRGPDKRYTEVYGLISMLDGGHTLVLSGITSVGTNGAAEFFSRPEGLKELRRRMGAAKEFQVVVKCASNDTLLLGTEYVAHRVVK
jgi:hypothetical protein